MAAPRPAEMVTVLPSATVTVCNLSVSKLYLLLQHKNII